jgi:DNA-binding response OmpR family regulator
VVAAREGDGVKVLVVEDEESIRRGLCDVLTFRGYQVAWQSDGPGALATALGGDFALIVLDVMLPGLDGFSVCRALRQRGERAAVLILTAKGAEQDVLAGFEAGADDYVTKPFSVREVLARVQALARRSGVRPSESFAFGALSIDPARSVARDPDGREVELSAREVRMLALLVRDTGRIVSRSLLLREVWDVSHPERLETRTVDVHMAKLRKKLGRDGARLETVRGQGYRLCSSR